MENQLINSNLGLIFDYLYQHLWQKPFKNVLKILIAIILIAIIFNQQCRAFLTTKFYKWVLSAKLVHATAKSYLKSFFLSL